MVFLLLLKPLAGELERPAVLGDSAHHIVRHAARDIRLNIQRHRDLRSHLPGKLSESSSDSSRSQKISMLTLSRAISSS